MPWTVSKDTTVCSVAKPWAVKKTATGAKAGCHATEADAKKQQAALYAQEKMSMENGTEHRMGVRLAVLDDALYVREKQDGGGGTTMHGHFAVFNEWTRINSYFEGTFMERIAPGSFTKTFQERQDKIRVLYQHGRDPYVGAKPLGTPDVLAEDDRGAHYEVSLFDVPYVADLTPALRTGQLGASFKFEVMREDVDREPERSDDNPDGIEERTIREVRLYEFGPVTFPAYEGATAGLRSITDDFMSGALLDFGTTHPEQMRDFLFTQLGADPDRLRDVITGSSDSENSTTGRTGGRTPTAPPAVTPDDAETSVSTSETGAAVRSKILTSGKKEDSWRLRPRRY